MMEKWILNLWNKNDERTFFYEKISENDNKYRVNI